jgi:hypothetical protein
VLSSLKVAFESTESGVSVLSVSNVAVERTKWGISVLSKGETINENGLMDVLEVMGKGGEGFFVKGVLRQ